MMLKHACRSDRCGKNPAHTRRVLYATLTILIALANTTVAAGNSADSSIEKVAAAPRWDEHNTFTFVWENDQIGGTDQNYTNGFRLAWLSGTEATDRVSDFLARKILGADGETVVRRGFALGHSIFTPDDKDTEAPLPDQHPYAAWLYAELTVLIEHENVVDQLTIQPGIVGSSAGGEWVQNEFHSLIGVEPARGWVNQIGDEFGLVVAYDRKMRALYRFGNSGLGADITPNVGFALGNVYTDAHAGLMLRFGQDLRSDFGAPRIRPSLAGAGYFTPRDGFGWYLFAGAEVRAVAHNIFLDGSLFDDDFPTVSSKPVVLDFQGGAAMQIGSTQFTLTIVQRSMEYENQASPQRFAAFSFGMKFD